MEYLSSSQRLERLPSPVSAFLPRDEDTVALLRDHDFDTRLQTLNRMILLCKKDVEWFTKFSKKGDLMKNLDRILAEDRWEVQHQAIRFLLEAMPSFGSNLEYCMAYIMPNLLPKLGSSKITIKRVTIQVMQNFTRLHPQALNSILVILNQVISKSADRLVTQEILNELPTMFQDWLRDGNWGTMVEGFMGWMSSTEDEETRRKIAMCLRKLQVFIGGANFDRFMILLTPQQRDLFAKEVESINLPASDVSAPSSASTPVSSTSSRSAKSGREMRMRFGIVPTYLATMLADEDPNTKSAALEKLKTIIETMSPESTAKLITHLHSFFVTLGNVLNDLNFKVIIQALDLVRLTVNRLKANVEAHLQQVITLISRHLGNQKAVVKQLVMMTVMDLFRSLNPKAVVAVICPFLEHKNSRVREEVLNIITSSLLVVPPSKMNLSALANLLVPRLVDPKRRVRLAAFEQLSVLAFHLNGKLDPILKLVKEFEQKCFEGLTTAVKARLLRGARPTLRYDGLLEYSTPPISDSSFDIADEALGKPENLDLHWILHINGIGERSSSPPTLFSSYKTVVKGEIAQQVLAQQKALWESESERDDASLSSVAMMERQNLTYPVCPLETLDEIKLFRAVPYKDHAVKSPSLSLGSLPLISPLMEAPPRRRSKKKKKTLQHPATSSNSWSSPLQKYASPTTSTPEANNNNRLRFLVIQKRTQQQSEAQRKPSQTNGKPIEEKPKRGPQLGRNKSDLSRARSETTLTDDRKENVPLSLSHDDTPIRGTKNGTYDAVPFSLTCGQ
ncbi:hypothetical protein PENTCL1PPCAC_126 [Pristionchus entomophagus]|uniref:TOG domain-containing protein n=1 Tax=Pristionchus entomophagus TaxID=358040 RepID=A0AAV5S5X3_9BILA|nr:hypothetical protein PENTCL1PPCAC_126 [Pristionchus entomophagus]